MNTDTSPARFDGHADRNPGLEQTGERVVPRVSEKLRRTMPLNSLLGFKPLHKTAKNGRPRIFSVDLCGA